MKFWDVLASKLYTVLTQLFNSRLAFIHFQVAFFINHLVFIECFFINTRTVESKNNPIKLNSTVRPAPTHTDGLPHSSNYNESNCSNRGLLFRPCWDSVAWYKFLATSKDVHG